MARPGGVTFVLIVLLACSLPAGALAQSACGGDCRGDGRVTIDELITAVNIALGRTTTAITPCPGLDRDASGEVAIDELVTAVAFSMSGCPTPTPTATPRPDGLDCIGGAQCVSTHCVNGVCCAQEQCPTGEFCAAGSGVCTGGPTFTPTATPTESETPAQSPTPTKTSTRSPTLTPTCTPTHTRSPTRTTTATETGTATVTPTSTFSVISFGCLAVVNELDRNVSFACRTTGGGSGSQGGAPADIVALNAIPRDVTLSASGKLAYVTTRDPDELAIIDVSTRQVVATIPDLGAQPEAVACTPDGELILVTNFGSNTVSIIDEPMLQRHIAQRRLSGSLQSAELSTAGMLTQVPVGVAPNALAITDTSDTAYVTNYGSRSVTVVDVIGAKAVKSVTVGDLPNDVALSPDGRLAFVTKFGSSDEQLSIIDTDTNEQLVSVPLPANAEVRPTSLTFAVMPGGETRLLVAALGLNDVDLFGIVYVFDLEEDIPTLARCFDFGPGPLDSPCQRFPEMEGILPSAVAAAPIASSALVASFRVEEEGAGKVSAAGGTLLEIDTSAAEFVGAREVGNFPVGLAIGPQSDTPVPTATPDPNATPTMAADESCGQTTCVAPSVCFRDLACHLNGCPPRDKCCPGGQPGCLACRGGANDAAGCKTGGDCPGGECVP